MKQKWSRWTCTVPAHFFLKWKTLSWVKKIYASTLFPIRLNILERKWKKYNIAQFLITERSRTVFTGRGSVRLTLYLDLFIMISLHLIVCLHLHNHPSLLCPFISPSRTHSHMTTHYSEGAHRISTRTCQTRLDTFWTCYWKDVYTTAACMQEESCFRLLYIITCTYPKGQ